MNDPDRLETSTDPADLYDARALGAALTDEQRAAVEAWTAASPQGRALDQFYAALEEVGRAATVDPHEPDAPASDPVLARVLDGAPRRRRAGRAGRTAAWASVAAAAAAVAFGLGTRFGASDDPESPVRIGPPSFRAPSVAVAPEVPADEVASHDGGWVRVEAERTCVDVAGVGAVCGRPGARFRVEAGAAPSVGRVLVAKGSVEIGAFDRAVVVTVDEPAGRAQAAAQVDLGPKREIVVLVLAGTVDVSEAGAEAVRLEPGRSLRIDADAPAPPPAASDRATPPTAADLLRRAQEAAADGDLASARAAYRRLVRTHPGSPEALAALPTLGRLELRAGRPRAALAAFDRYLARGDGATRIEALLGRARALEALGRTPEAVAAWRAVLEAHPGGIHADEARRRIAALSDPG
ncbi:MAG: hypothetical protein D6705_02020 [Deltaproteobacteria bacterium]|nr:MAG: hypothetical protein D6705_02020 [Deltaproteobacteria bacterium]